MKRPAPANAETPGGVPEFSDPTWRTKLPVICEYLTHDSWEDGAAREVSTVSIKAQEGRVLCVLNDPEMARSLYVTADDVTKGLAALEKALNAPAADWRAWKGQKPKRK